MTTNWRVPHMTYTHIAAPTEFAEAEGIRFAYRRFGTEEGVPLLFMPHYRGGMDHWDPAVTDGFAASRPVILFDNAGIPVMLTSPRRKVGTSALLFAASSHPD
jgi:hypothetical protein